MSFLLLGATDSPPRPAKPGYDEPDGASIIDPDGVGPAIGFLRVPEPRTAKNRLHIDVRVAGNPPWDPAERIDLMRAKVAELMAAGATFFREDGDHVVMLDPEDNEFLHRLTPPGRRGFGSPEI